MLVCSYQSELYGKILGKIAEAMHKIFFTPLSEEDLQNIYAYIAEDNPFYAEDVLSKIHHSIDFLKEFPLIGTELEGNKRYIVEPRYRYKIVYRISNSDTIEILSVFKYKENWNIA